MSRRGSPPLRGADSPFLTEELLVFESPGQWEEGALPADRASAHEDDRAPAGVEETESEEPVWEVVADEEQGVVGVDNRVRIRNTTGVPWRWICKIVIEDSRGRPLGGGTGLLVSDRHVLTAAHVVHAAYRNMQQHTIAVVPGLDSGAEPFDSYPVRSKPRIRQQYDPSAADHLDWDYALLKLDRAAGAKSFPVLNGNRLCYWGSPQCGADTVFARLDPGLLNGRAAYTAGYPRTHGARQLWCAAGILHSASERARRMWITADTTEGQSGSPVWVIDDKRYCLVGVAAGAGTDSNVVVRVTREMVRQIRAWISSDGDTPSMTEAKELHESASIDLGEAEPEPEPEGWEDEAAPYIAEPEEYAFDDAVDDAEEGEEAEDAEDAEDVELDEEVVFGDREEEGEVESELTEGLVPDVSDSDLRKRIDEYFEKANFEYNLGSGVRVKARPQFRYSTAGGTEEAILTVSRILGSKFEKAHPRAIRYAAYGRAKPDEIAAITQALIDAGELDAVRSDNPGISEAQLVRKLQRKFRMGIDCAGYVQLAFLYAFLGSDDDPKKVRKAVGFHERRGYEKLAKLPAAHFRKVDVTDARTGDLFVLEPRADSVDHAWHTVVIVERSASSDVHTFVVDASWGTDLYGEDAGGVQRRKWVFDASSRKWWDIHPVDGSKAHENTTGPYDGHRIKGMYRAKRKK